MSYTCENIEEGNTCGAPAEFTAITPWSRRNVCARCKYIFESQGREVRSIEDADIDRPAVAPLRIHHKADGSVELWCYCGAVGKIRAGVDPYPLCDEHAPHIVEASAPSTIQMPAPRTSRPPLRDAFIDVAQAVLEFAKQKLERLRKGDQP